MATTELSANVSDPWLVLGRDEGVQFHQTWLACLVQGMGGEVREGALLLADPSSGHFHPVAMWPGQAVSADLAQLSEQALEKRTSLTAYRGRGMLAHLVMVDGDLRGLVALAFVGAVPRNAMPWLRWGQGWLERSGWQGEKENEAELRERLLLALDLTMVALEAPRAEAAVHATVTEAASRLQCDRVSVGFVKGSQVHFSALSHAVDVARRIDLIHAIEAAMNEALEQSIPIHVGLYDAPRTEAGGGQGGGQPDWITIRDHQRLVRDFGAETVLSVPFAAGEQETRRLGVFVFEWPESDVAEVRLRQAEALTPILGRVLLNRRWIERRWYQKLLDGVTEGSPGAVGSFGVRRRLLALLVLALTFFLSVTEGDYRLSASAVLEGGVRRAIVAPFDGYVTEARIRAGHVVKEGTELVRLDDRDIRLEVSRWASQQAQFQKQTDDAQAQHDLSKIQIALAQARQAAAQRELSESMLSRSRIAAPFDGVIVSGDLSQHLGGTVSKGQTLFEIAPLDAYRVVLQVEEYDVGRIAIGQRGELMVAALPGETFPFIVTLVTPVASVTDGRNHFRVEANLDSVSKTLRPGMEGVGKIDVHRKLLVWIWTHRFFEWLRLQIWSWVGI